jgi:hypothetical protein
VMFREPPSYGSIAATARADRWLRERLDRGSPHDPSGDVPVRAFVSQGIDQIVRSSDSTSRRRNTASAPSSLTCADTWHRAHAVDWCLTVLRGRRTTCFKGFFEGLLVELLHEVGCGHGSRIGRSSRFAPQRGGHITGVTPDSVRSAVAADLRRLLVVDGLLLLACTRAIGARAKSMRGCRWGGGVAARAWRGGCGGSRYVPLSPGPSSWLEPAPPWPRVFMSRNKEGGRHSP